MNTIIAVTKRADLIPPLQPNNFDRYDPAISCAATACGIDSLTRSRRSSIPRTAASIPSAVLEAEHLVPWGSGGAVTGTPLKAAPYAAQSTFIKSRPEMLDAGRVERNPLSGVPG